MLIGTILEHKELQTHIPRQTEALSCPVRPARWTYCSRSSGHPTWITEWTSLAQGHKGRDVFTQRVANVASKSLLKPRLEVHTTCSHICSKEGAGGGRSLCCLRRVLASLAESGRLLQLESLRLLRLLGVPWTRGTKSLTPLEN